MSKHILVAQLSHETHTFLKQKTGLTDFMERCTFHGQEIVKQNLGNGSPMDGFLTYAAQREWTVYPSIQMAAMPSGLVEDEVVNYFNHHFFQILASELHHLDAIYLVLHGAMVSESYFDVEGELLSQIQFFFREHEVEIPVVGIIDLHANVSQQMVDSSDCLLAYKKNPHTDARQTAIDAVELLDDIFLQYGKVKQIRQGSPYILPPTGVGTAVDPMKSILARAREIEAEDPDIVCVNVLAGYAYADIPDCGFSLTCATHGSVDQAQTHLVELLGVLKQKINLAYPSELSLEQALEQSDLTPKGDNGTILLIEAADNIGGGTPGDATGILAPLLEAGRKHIVAVINDPGAAKVCHRHGLGKRINLEIGGKTDLFHGSPVTFAGEVVHLSTGIFELENKNSHLASMTGTRIRMGPSAVIRNQQATILLTTHKTPPMDLGQLHSQGIEPKEADYIIVKAAVSHKQAYDPIAAGSFNIDSPGLCTSNLKRLAYQHVRRPVFPLDEL